MKKIVGTILIVAGITLFVSLAIDAIHANYEYTNAVQYSWNLADKASTIQQKSQYIDQFVHDLANSGLYGTNQAVFLPTQDTSFNSNFQALQSLQQRLHTIEGMDENSIAYQNAIQQITAQEQGQADNMLAVFQGCWNRVHHYLLWNWITVLVWIILAIGTFVSGIVVINLDDFDD